jgi:hypothetical protein
MDDLLDFMGKGASPVFSLSTPMLWTSFRTLPPPRIAAARVPDDGAATPMYTSARRMLSA